MTPSAFGVTPLTGGNHVHGEEPPFGGLHGFSDTAATMGESLSDGRRGSSVPVVGGRDLLTLVDGRTFAISDRQRRRARGCARTRARRPSPPLALRAHRGRHSADTDRQRRHVAVRRPRRAPATRRDGAELSALLIRRRRLAEGLRDDVELWSTGRQYVSVLLTIEFGADFAHIFDVKAGAGRAPAPVHADSGRDQVHRS